MNRRDSLKSLSLLTGVTLSSGLTSGLLSSCAPTYDPGYRLKFFTPDQDELVAELVEMIIPATDTPGAKAVGVNQLIDAMMASWASEEERKMFSDGLVMLNKLADEKQRAFFVDLVADSRVETLREVEKESKKTQTNFFKQLKMLTLYGYYTSEVGATQELKYLHTAGEWKADIPYSEVGKSYS